MQLSAYSEKKLVGVHPDLQKVVRKAAEYANGVNTFEIVQGNRTEAEQDALYAQGRTKPGPVVTWTRNSKHEGGRAIDFAATVGGKISWNDKLYPPIASLFERAAQELRIGIQWGGEWRNKDWGHIELDPTATGQIKIVQNTTVPKFALIRRGQEGELVEGVQEALVRNGFYTKVDGDFGPDTEKKVKEFQLKHGLKADGIVGPLTWSALQQKVAPPATVPTQTIMPAAFSAGKDYDKVCRFYEGERLSAYQIGGLWHIGIGHHGSYRGQVISKAESTALFEQDTLKAIKELRDVITVALTQNQIDALIDLSFNRPRTFAPEYIKGSGMQPADDLIEAINAKDWNKAELEWLELVRAPALDGRVYPGLATRRQTEVDLFMGREYSLG